MPDLQVVAIITAKAGSEDIVRNALTDLVEPTRGEDGCVSYELSQSVVDPTVFVTVESWASQADLDAHMQTPHIEAAFAAAGDHMAGAPAIHPLNLIR